jgi:membrane protein YdbS with pleckstrin-like domain
MVVTLSMNFTNSVIAPEELPSMEDVNFHPLEKDFLVVERISLLIFMGLLLAIGVVFFSLIENLQKPLIISAAVTVYGLFVLLRLIAINIGYKYSGYALRERDVLFRSGWLKRKTRVVILNRVQHVSVQSGPLERKFGLSSVSIFTAGSSEADFTINGITEETAQRIKAWISAEPDGNGEH